MGHFFPGPNDGSLWITLIIVIIVICGVISEIKKK